MKILIIGSGGREHAILHQVLKSEKVKTVFVAPGNAGMAEVAQCVAIPVENVELLKDFALKNHIDLTIVGPELPLTLGIVDVFESEGLRIFGPSKKASIVEGSKIFTKEFCARHNIPTAPFFTFDDSKEAKAHLAARKDYPVVIKADGLAAGKGVIIAQNTEEAQNAVSDMMLYERFGSAGRKVLIEDFLPGEEASFIVATDGENFVEFPSAQDHKRVFDQDKGPNTGGMGAYSPAPLVTAELRKKVIERIIVPTLAGLKAEDRFYKGFLYAGLMVNDKGDPYLIEYNCRLGDPEAEVILPPLESDFIALIESVLSGTLNSKDVRFAKGACVGVVLASGGYPDAYEKGFVISGLEDVKDESVTVYHAGTKKKDTHFVTDGGRVLVVSAKADTLENAIAKVYENVEKISWAGLHFRKDIGAKGLKRLQRI